MIVLNHPQGSEDWLRARVGACTASRFSDAIQRVGSLTGQQASYVSARLEGLDEKAAAKAAGYRAAPTAQAVERALRGERVDMPGADAMAYAWLLAVETVAREPLDETFVTYAMRRGRELEPVARAVYERRTGAWVDEVSLVLTDDEKFGYSSDGFVGDDGLIEIKCPLSAEKVGKVWAQPGAAHLEYINQINGGLWITGRKWCDLVVYCPWLAHVGKDLFVRRIHRDEQAIETLESRLLEFLPLVEANLAVLRRPTTMAGYPKDPTDVPADPMAPPWDLPTAAPIAPPAAVRTPQPLPATIF